MNWVEMVALSLHVALIDYDRVLILKEKTGSRYLPISINPLTANAISLCLHEQPLPNPPYDFVYSTVQSLGAEVKKVIVHQLKGEIFQAKAILTCRNETVEVLCGPGEAIAIALKAGAPIYVTESILSKAGISVEEMGRLSDGKSEGW